MRIQVDAVNKPPPHTLEIRDIKAILAIVPDEWKRFVSRVRLSAEMPYSSRFGRPVILSYPRLTICSRGLSREAAYKEVLSELAISGMRISLRMVHRLSKSDLQKVDEAIAPLLEILLAEDETSAA